VLLAAVAWGVATVKSADQAPTTPPPAAAQTRCPVMGGAINRAIYADHAGQRIYFCCRGCIERFRADPERYLKVMEKQGVQPEAAPAPTPSATPKEPPATDEGSEVASATPEVTPESTAEADASPTPAATAPAAADWTCPMHPQIHQATAGNCPLCGMKLVPAKAGGGTPSHGGHGCCGGH
jgi:YHS domain-containing protein